MKRGLTRRDVFLDDKGRENFARLDATRPWAHKDLTPKFLPSAYLVASPDPAYPDQSLYQES